MPEVISYIGLGSNQDGPAEQLAKAIVAIKKLPQSTFLACSSFYRSKALTLMNDEATPDYLNAVVSIQTGLEAHHLLDELQAIESSQGRVRGEQRWESRPLDLDILLYADSCIADERLTIPHAEMCQRDFVLLPLAEIAPEAMITGKGSVASCLASCQPMVIEKTPYPGS